MKKLACSLLMVGLIGCSDPQPQPIELQGVRIVSCDIQTIDVQDDNLDELTEYYFPAVDVPSCSLIDSNKLYDVFLLKLPMGTFDEKQGYSFVKLRTN